MLDTALAARVAALPLSMRRELLASLSDEETADLLYDWEFWARPDQLPPPGDWSTWLVRAGRGFGKTRLGGGWVHKRAMAEKRWIAIVAKTPADARDYCIEGPGGILSNVRPDEKPDFHATKRRLTWPNGSHATIYSDEVPDQLRGYSGDTAWLDEFAKYKHPDDVWSNLAFGMREASADRPRRLITTTPRPLKVMREIELDPGTVTVTGTSDANRLNLDPSWYAVVIDKYRNTRLGRQEILGEYLDDMPGALWRRDDLERYRVERAPESLRRVVVAVDPAITSTGSSDETGIVVAGIDGVPSAYVLEDFTLTASPDAWARRAVSAYRIHQADCIVGEANQGGDLVKTVIHSVDRTVNVKLVHASRGKVTRAEPVAAVYEQGRVHHVGIFGDLEDQMCTMDPATGLAGGVSPDRVDALVWAIAELMPGLLQAPRGYREDRPPAVILPRAAARSPRDANVGGGAMPRVISSRPEARRW